MGITRRKKINLNTKVKASLIGILGLIIILMGILLYREIAIKKTITEEHVLYEYACQPTVTYSVHIIDNKIYDSKVLEEGMEYSKNILDYIEARFLIEFQGSEPTDAELNYHITANTRGYKNVADGIAVNWKKKYELKEATNLTSSEQYYTEEAVASFGLDEYSTFADEANEVLGMQLASDLIVDLEGNLSINTKYGKLNTPINITLTVPLLQNEFSITKDEIPVISDSIKEYKEVILPVNKNKIVLFSTASVISVLLIIIILFTTKAPSIYEIQTSNAKKLLKNYSSRIIALQNKTEQEFNQTYELNAMLDLIKVADEIQKPIYYFHDEFFVLGNYTFHVADGENQYIYRIMGEIV